MELGRNSPRPARLSQGAQSISKKLLVTNLGIDDLEKSQMELPEGGSKLRYLIQEFYPYPEVRFSQSLHGKLVVLDIKYDMVPLARSQMSS